ncbi:Transcriptional regulatory protein DegU [compost metagenome]|uniref:LuxR C-terminal-related transcriptional regulator n=1 Tax=Pedobacter sp. ok626 TaxID=1761882 RepID=UPI0008809867|nr:response regulator transcription factor [Pedobacter sp. ok626]SDL98505.1 DNA-binding response regulator, NarL/FixJ family, contains REC and HTH domains [Pedobacter sp. ok626]
MNGIKIGIMCNREFIRRAFIASLVVFQEKIIEIVFETTIESFQNVIPRTSRPDILLLDIDSPDISGTKVIENVLSCYPDCSIILVSDIDDKDTLLKYIHAGARGCLKKVNQDKLATVISAVMDGGCYISPAYTKLLFDHVLCTRKRLSELSYREQQMVDAVIDGLSYKLIAYRHNISIDTVRFYLKKIYRKLNINSKGELLALMRLNSN